MDTDQRPLLASRIRQARGSNAKAASQVPGTQTPTDSDRPGLPPRAARAYHAPCFVILPGALGSKRQAKTSVVLTFHSSVTFFCLLAGSSVTILQNSGPCKGAARLHRFAGRVLQLRLQLGRPAERTPEAHVPLISVTSV